MDKRKSIPPPETADDICQGREVGERSRRRVLSRVEEVGSNMKEPYCLVVTVRLLSQATLGRSPRQLYLLLIVLSSCDHFPEPLSPHLQISD